MKKTVRTRLRWVLRLASATVAFSGLVLLASCGGDFFVDDSTGSGTSKHVLYVVNNNGGDTGSVTPLAIKSSGKLSKITSAVTAGSGPTCVAITSGNTFLYVGNLNGGISAYSVASNGELAELSSSPYATGITPVSLTIESGGNYLYALDTSSSAVSVYRISSSTGALTSVQTVYFSNVASVSGPLYAVQAAPHKKYLYVSLGSDGTWIYKINSGGTLTYASTVSAPAGGSATSLAFDPDGNYAYQADGENNVWAYAVNQSGGLTALAGSPYAVGTNPVTAAVDPTGKYVYVVNQGSNSVSAFSKSSDGLLTALAGDSRTGDTPTSVVIESGGKFVFVTNESGSPDVSIFQIQSDGTLSSLGTASSGTTPMSAVSTHY